MKTLKAKFGKFAVSREKMAKVKGGVMAICSDGENEWAIAADSVEELKMDEESGECNLVYMPIIN